MRKKCRRSREIRDFILRNVADNPKSIGQLASQHFSLSRQSISKHLNALVEEGSLSAFGKTRARVFKLRRYISTSVSFDVTNNLEEDIIWRENVRIYLDDLKENVMDICRHGFTEMVNNIADHSESSKFEINVYRTAITIQIIVQDFGIGIFNKIQRIFNLHDPRHSLLELVKGKLTTDKSSHSGEGIFFTSRIFDKFYILSGNLIFSRTNYEDDWLIESDNKEDYLNGTLISMEITSYSDRTIKEIFDRHASEQADWGFTKTHVPLELLRYEGEKLISRSQAKRLLARVDQFKEVILDFKGITEIGQAFADEIFRVFVEQHPETIILPFHTNPDIDQMIQRVISNKDIRQISII